MYDIADPYKAFCFDQAVGYFGGEVQGVLEKVKGKNAKQIEAKQDNKLRQMLGMQMRFRDPMEIVRKAAKDEEVVYESER